MLLSTTTDYMSKSFGMEKAIEIIAEAGFDAADFSVFTDEHCTDVHNLDYYKELRKFAEDKGIVFNQCHAPFPSSVVDDEDTKIRFKKITTAMQNAACLGVKNVIVHPNQHLKYNEGDNAEKLFEMNMEFYGKLLPYCEEYGVHVALENMWQHIEQGCNKIGHSTCSVPDEFLRYLEALNSEWMVACLDIGHAALVCEEPDKFIHKLGRKYLKALHVHEVDGFSDMHTLPFTCNAINWDKVAKALADINYEGDITFEADVFLLHRPLELYPACAKFMESTGRYIINKVNEYK